MQLLVDAIQSGDFCSLVFFSICAVFLGDRMINSRPQLRVWGLRLTAVATAGFAVLHLIDAKSPSPSDFAMAAVVGLLGGLVVLGPTWVVLSFIGYFGGYYTQATSVAQSMARRRQDERERKLADQKREKEQQEWEINAPQRARAQQEHLERQRIEERASAQSKKRRVDARADCEMLYQLYAVDISSRFPREAFDEWIKKYMGEDQPPDEVEQRAEQLRKMIIHHREMVKPTPKFQSLPELANWFQKQKSEIEALSMDDRIKRMLLANLNMRNAELMSQLLEDR